MPIERVNIENNEEAQDIAEFLISHEVSEPIEQPFFEDDHDDLLHYDDPEENHPDDEVKLYESDEKIKFKDAVYVNHFGFFKKDDPRIFKDKFYNIKLIIDKKHIHAVYPEVFAIYDDIDSKGNLINPSYTVCYEMCNNLVKVAKDDYNFAPYVFIEEKLLENNVFKYYYIESLQDGKFYHKDSEYFNKDMLVKKNNTLYRKHKYKTSFKELFKNKPMTYIKMLGKKYTWGVEIETSSGYLPNYLDNKLIYDAVHDGSLRDEEGHVYGGEYVTSVLHGDLGLQQLKMLCNELSKRCMINKKCGVHVHVGNVTFNKESIILMYYLYKRVENEIFAMLPESRRNNEYCKKLPDINISVELIQDSYDYYIDYYYNKIMTILSSGNPANRLVNKKNDHPKGFKCGYDHNTARYCWVNFIPAVFNTRKNEIYTIN